MDANRTPALSIVVRVRNERDALHRLLKSLEEQCFDRDFEVIVIDNESNDDSAEVALALGARVFSLPRHLFSYGRAINLGVRRCRAGLVMLLSAHVLPCEKNFLQSMVENLESRPAADALFCLQRPGSPIGKAETVRYSIFPPNTCVIDRETVLRRLRQGKCLYEASYLSNSACILRRAAAESCPMRDLPYAEENAFALDLLLRNRSVAYCDATSVYYNAPFSANRLYEQERRQMIAKKLIEEHFGPSLCAGDPSWSARLGPFIEAALIPVTLVGIACRWLFDKRYSSASRALLFDLCAIHGTLGKVVGTATWRRFRKSIAFNPEELAEAEAAIKQLRPP